MVNRIDNTGVPAPLEGRGERELPAADVGGKAANLIRLRSVLTTATIPPFITLSNTHVKAYIKSMISSLEGDWDRFCSLVREDVLSPEAKAALLHIHNKITAAFESHDLSFLPALDPTKKLMIRSSGDEDRPESANAGGNLSVPSDPDRRAVIHAIGQVVASYFSEKSIEQRLLGHEDVTVFPLCSVLIQELIGESAEVIPCSFVMYSKETGMDTAGLVHIQAAYGHGEGIVESRVPFDSYYMSGGHLVSSTIAHKSVRLRKGEGSGLDSVTNSEALAEQPALSPKVLITLQRTAEEIERAFGGKEMDIEGVVIDNQVYIVQARPLVAKKPMRPSYIDTTRLPAGSIIESVRLIAEGQGSVIKIEHPLIEKTLEKALERFLKETGPFDAVFVEEMAASTSHAATVFRGESLPIVSLLSGTHIKEKGLIPLLDVQRQKLYYVQAMPLELISEGRIAFPRAREESLLASTEATRKKIWESLPRGSATDKRSFQLSAEQRAVGFLSSLEKIGTSESAEVQLRAVDFMMKRLLMLLKKGAPGIVIGAALEALATIKEKLQGIPTPETNKQLLFAKRTLESAIFQDETASIASSSSLKAFFLELKRTQRAMVAWTMHGNPSIEAQKVYCALYPLERMVFAQKNKVNFEIFLYRFAVESHHSLRTRIITVLRGLVGGSAPATRETEFAKRRFFEAIRSASQLGLLPYLMNQVFSESRDPLTVIAEFEKAILDAKSHEAVLAPFAKAALWENRLAEWGDPRQFAKLFADWKETLKTISDNAFTESNASGLKSTLTPAFVQIWGQKLLDFVDLFDRTIKEIKGSPSYSPEEKLLYFKEMLLLYGELMEKIFAAVPVHITTGLRLGGHSEFTPLMNGKAALKKYGEIILRDLKSKVLRGSSEFFPSPRFDVSGATIGSNANLGRQYQNLLYYMTLEDFFTLEHQNQLAALCRIMQKGSLAVDSLPEAVNILIKMLPRESRIGYIDCTPFPDLHIRMDIPQQNHSSFVEIVYNNQKKEINFSFHLVGDNATRKRRLSRASADLIILALNLGFSPSSHQISTPVSTVVKWTFNASNAATFAVMSEHLDTYLEALNHTSAAFPTAFFTSPVGARLFDEDPTLKADILSELSASDLFHVRGEPLFNPFGYQAYSHIRKNLIDEEKIAAIYEIAQSDPTFYPEITDVTLPGIVALSPVGSKAPSRLDKLYSHIHEKGLEERFIELVSSHERLDLLTGWHSATFSEELLEKIVARGQITQLLSLRLSYPPALCSRLTALAVSHFEPYFEGMNHEQKYSFVNRLYFSSSISNIQLTEPLTLKAIMKMIEEKAFSQKYLSFLITSFEGIRIDSAPIYASLLPFLLVLTSAAIPSPLFSTPFINKSAIVFRAYLRDHPPEAAAFADIASAYPAFVTAILPHISDVPKGSELDTVIQAYKAT